MKATKKHDFKKIIDWKSVCKFHGISEALPDASSFPEDTQAFILACHKLPLIVSAIRNNWVPPRTKTNNPVKYSLWAWIEGDEENPSGVGLSLDVLGSWASGSDVGPRFEFQTREQAQHAWDHFKEDWKSFYLMPLKTKKKSTKK